jgi:hypothetical protein
VCDILTAVYCSRDVYILSWPSFSSARVYSAGVYSAASERTCANWSASLWNEGRDARTFALEWEIDFLKYAEHILHCCSRIYRFIRCVAGTTPADTQAGLRAERDTRPWGAVSMTHVDTFSLAD